MSASGAEAFIWDEENGIRSIQDILVNDCHMVLTSWSLYRATDVPDDGRMIVGSATNQSGDRKRGFLRWATQSATSTKTATWTLATTQYLDWSS